MKNYYNFQQEKKTYFKSEAQIEREKERRLRNFRLWVHQNNLKGKDIIIAIKAYLNYIKKQIDILNGDDLNSKKKIVKLQRKKKEQKEGKIPNDSAVSKKCREILNKIYTKIDFMKNETQELTRKNGISLQNTQREFFRKNNFNDKLPSIETINNFYNNNNNSQIKKNNINFIRINDIFRRELNREFNMFNPFINLQNLNELKKYNIKVKENLDLIKEKIDNEIQEKNDGYFYKKKYDKVHNKFLKTTSNFSTNNNNKSMGKTKSTAFNSMNNTKNNFKPKKKNYFEKEFDLMEDALDSLYYTLEIDPILQYIEEFKKIHNFDKKDFKERELIYFPQLNKTESALQKIFVNKVSNENDKTTEQINNFADNQQFSLLKNLENSKEKLLEEVFQKNNINSDINFNNNVNFNINENNNINNNNKNENNNNNNNNNNENINNNNIE